ncbi:acyl carrier protein [Fervidobacterium riparium]|uniref:Acyl carrier protein n=1 Tax=Fervidobacterium gondwanense DSM 13020 TaxID=1121883 RepID=A0A1M7S7S2_FERGO|nr:acyl carrier protein [Fervidobacterium gondwanense]UXF00913.1 acyl carrier protein [Fervidobacterium riparium]SHN54414.1 acyl carrier protein [Fervidobacterium gondwanense DSM 13020]
MEELESKVCEIIAEQLGVDASDVKLEKSLTEDLGADSLDIVDLVMAFEDEFGVKISDQDLSKIKTVKDVVDAIKLRI